MIQGDQDDSSVLDRRARGRVFLLRCAMYVHGCKSALAWGLILYLLAFAVSDRVLAGAAHCADLIILPLGSPQSAFDAAIAPCLSEYGGCDSGFNPTSPNSSCYAEWQPYADAGWQAVDAAAREHFSYPGCNGSYSHPAVSDDDLKCFAAVVVTPGLCPETGEPPVEVNGELICEEPPDPCLDASEDDAFNSTTQNYNPGLCELGDMAYSNQRVCAYSETAGQNCEADLIEDITLDALLPPQVTINSSLNFSNVPCSEVTTPDPYEFESCEEPPLTCPVDHAPVLTGGEWVCKPIDDISQTPPDEDLEPVPDPPTAGPEIVTTTTTTTVTNPDGSTTSTSTTTTEYGPCPEGETCTGEMDYEGPGDRVGEVKTFGQSLKAFLEGAQATPIMSAADGIADAIPSAATCPTWTSGTIPIINTSITLDGHCVAIEGQEGTIRAIMLVAWGIAGLFILLSA